MNYIKHLSVFFERVIEDETLNPTHISLYVALFQFWNINRFHNPISISRSDVMRVSKICAKATYHKCMKDLHNLGYIKYVPSYNPFKGSLVYLFDFAPDQQPVQKTDSRRTKKQTSTGTGTEQALVPSINNINIINNISDANENSETQILETNKPEMAIKEKTKRKKVPAKKEKGQIPPTLEQVKTFFKLEVYPELEAQRFFNHFQSNGWKVGGKSPMKDWNAAARNWMLNYQKFHPSKPGVRNFNLNNTKNYGEPL